MNQFIFRISFVFLSIGSCLIVCAQANVKRVPWSKVFFEIVSDGYEQFPVSEFEYVFSGKKNCIIKLAPELKGLTGVKDRAGHDEPSSVQRVTLKFRSPVKVVIGIFRSSESVYCPQPAPGKLNPTITNALTIAGLPPVDVFTTDYSKGTHVIYPEAKGLFLILGVIKPDQALQVTDAQLPDGTLWDPFLVEGYYDDNPLFEILSGPDAPVIDEGMPGTEGILGGFEGGACVKIGDIYHMFPTERAGQEGIDAYYDRVKTRIGHWTSKDAIHWKRESTIYQASGVYAITDDDNPMNDRRGAIWSYMPVFNERTNRWNGYYLAYTVHKEIEPNHSFGRIWRCESVKEGIDGIGGPYRDVGIIIEPGLDTQLWEGRQGVDSFFPYPAGDNWLGFYGGAYPFEKREDYPRNARKGAWYVGLATAESMEGPWTRMDTTINPVTSMHPYFIENPIVCKLPGGIYIAIFDGGPEAWGLYLPNMMGYSLSKDGYHWSEARYLPVETKVQKWWDIMRTPVCLIDEGDNLYTILYAAIDVEKRFHPMGMVKVKLNPSALQSMQLPLK